MTEESQRAAQQRKEDFERRQNAESLHEKNKTAAYSIWWSKGHKENDPNTDLWWQLGEWEVEGRHEND